MSARKEIVRWDRPVMRHYIAIPRIAKEELTPHEFKLYAHYIDETRWTHSYQNGGRGTARECPGFNKDSVCTTRAGLEAKGYVKVIPGLDPEDADTVILLYEVWERNNAKYDSPESQFEELLNMVAGFEMSDEQRALLLEKLGVEDSRHVGVEDSRQGDEDFRHPGVENPRQNPKFDGSQSNPVAGKASGGTPAGLTEAEALAERARLLNEGKEAGKVVSAKHPMILYLLGKYKRKTLTKEMLSLLQNPIKTFGERGELKSPSLLEHWDDVPGFEEFAKERTEEGLSYKNPVSLDNLLRHLRKLDLAPDDPKKKVGFWKWAERHPALCAAAPASEALADDTPPADAVFQASEGLTSFALDLLDMQS